MTNEKTNQVRQILMNELGLTREVIREEMLNIIKDTIQKHFTSGVLDNKINIIVERKLGEILKNSNFYSFEALKELVAKRVDINFNKFLQEEVKEKITSKLKITMNCEIKE